MWPTNIRKNPSTATAAALDGNLAANRTAVSASFALNGAWIPGSLLILRWTSSGSGDGLAIDDFSFSATAPIAPTTQDNSISFSGTTTVATTVTWVNGDGASHLVKINTTNSFTNPLDLNGYIGNSVYSGSGEQTVYVGTGNTVNISGLTSGTQYFFRAYGYNGTGASSRYNISTATGNPTDVTTLPPSSATKLVIASVNNGSNPIAGQPFSVVVQSRDGANNLQPVGLNTTFTLSTFIGLYALAGTTSGTIIAGTNSIIVT